VVLELYQDVQASSKSTIQYLVTVRWMSPMARPLQVARIAKGIR